MEITLWDAWLLSALAYGKGNPLQTLAAADHVMVALPSYEDWVHACEVLGERGLIAPESPLPVLTPLGESLALPLIRTLLPRQVPKRLLELISSLPKTGTPLHPPSREVLEAALSELNRRFD
jgi:hypothetical protein